MEKAILIVDCVLRYDYKIFKHNFRKVQCELLRM